MASALVRYSMWRPSRRTWTRPTSLRTRRCLETEGCSRLSASTISPTERSSRARKERISRRRGSAAAVKASEVVEARGMWREYIPIWEYVKRKILVSSRPLKPATCRDEERVGAVTPAPMRESLGLGRSWSRRRGGSLRFVEVEVHLRRGAGAFISLEVGLVAGKAAHAGDQAVGEERDESVVLLNHIVVAAPLDSDAVFGAGELVLQAEKIFIGFELGIVFRDDQQTA